MVPCYEGGFDKELERHGFSCKRDGCGGMAGGAAEEAITRQKGLEITVQLDSGQLIAVTQAADENFEVGERVCVLSDHDITRVTH